MQTIFGTAILIAAILGAALLAVGLIDGNRFVTVREEFVLPGLSKECRFVLISDLHNKVYGDRNDKVIAKVQKSTRILSYWRETLSHHRSVRI